MENMTIDGLKKEARALRVEQEKKGGKMAHCDALEQVAKHHGFDSWRACVGKLSTSSSSALGPVALLPPSAAPVKGKAAVAGEKYTINRDGDLPLRFTGHEIASDSEQEELNGHYQRTTIYKTVGGKYVAVVVQDNNSMKKISRQAGRFDTAKDLVDWLRQLRYGPYETSIRALGAAAEIDPEIDSVFGEDVA